MNKKLIAIVPAAGIGKRANTHNNLPKQYRQIAGESILRLTVKALLAEPRINHVIVAVAKNDDLANKALAGLGQRVLIKHCGGPDRADTVRNALCTIDDLDNTWVLVHDAARPGLPASILANLINSCWQYDNGGLLALPVADTLKYAQASNDLDCVQKTINRDHLWQAQTPQMFLATQLDQALKLTINNSAVTDEASAIELSGIQAKPPLLIMGARENFKLTYPDDFVWFEKFIFNSKND